jgi:hypothetical protein
MHSGCTCSAPLNTVVRAPARTLTTSGGGWDGGTVVSPPLPPAGATVMPGGSNIPAWSQPMAATAATINRLAALAIAVTCCSSVCTNTIASPPPE